MLSCKCNACKATFNLSPYDGSFFYFKNTYFCKECFIANRTKKRAKGRWKEEEIEQKLQEYEGTTKAHVKELTDKDDFYTYLNEHYAPTYVPRHFYMRMASVFDGTFKGLNVPIPAGDLLDMLQQKAIKLDKMAIKKWGSKQPEPMQRIVYDIAVVMAKYDRYLAWKATQAMETQEAIQNAEERKQTSSFIPVAKPVTKQENDSKLDIASIIDDLLN